MQIGEGKRIVGVGSKMKAVACTRWEELK